jgi:tetratricopeptide (TPR) repeat protein
MPQSPHQQDVTAPAFDEALNLQKQGRLNEAVACFQAILANHSDHVLSLCCLSLCLADLGRWDEALRLGRQATDIAASSAEAWHCLGNVESAMGNVGAAADSFLKMLAIRPAFAEGHNNLGKALIALKRKDAALHCFTAASILKPDFAEAYNNLGVMLHELDRQEEAITFYKRALRIKPTYADALYGLGNSLAALKRYQDALVLYEAALTFRADFAEAYNNIGTALQMLGRHNEAARHFQRTIALQPAFAKPYNNLGSALQALERIDTAESCYRKAVTLESTYAEAHYNLGIALTESGRLDEAFDAFETAIQLAPERGSFYRMLAETRPIDENSRHFRRMEELAGDMAALPEIERMELHFALGKVYGDCARHARAFDHLLAGNRLKRRTIAYDEAGTLASLGRVQTVFTRERVASGREIGVHSRLPVFIVGMPRSGTTLIEQILASHPQMFGAGELQDLRHLVNALPSIDGVAAFPEIVARLPEEKIRQLGTAYLAGLQARAPSAERIVDKMLANFKRIGLIHMALPDARIIHVRRDPVDTCLACFSKLFASAQPYAYDLAELGRYYRAYDTLMAHWLKILPPGVMLEVRYEDVVADLEGQARGLIEHCGIDWDNRCLSFHQTQRMVRTASAAQVRQPLYQTSVGRWRVYGEMARPLLDALECPDRSSNEHGCL